MKVMQLSNDALEPLLIEVEYPIPEPGKNEILIQVHAAGVTPSELEWYPTTHTKDGEARQGAVPGHEFSGVVKAMGPSVTAFAVDDEVYGMNDWFHNGATAEYCMTTPECIAAKPVSLSHEAAATVPIGALTAWQGLISRAHLQFNERILIHGGSGCVGSFAVQLAHLHGAHVIATASSANTRFVEELGADEVIDYQSTRFEDVVESVDVIFDTVGGDTLERSWPLLRSGGRLVTIASGSANVTEQRVQDAFFIVEPNSHQLTEIAKLLDSGQLRAILGSVFAFEDAIAAYLPRSGHSTSPGKAAVVVSR